MKVLLLSYSGKKLGAFRPSYANCLRPIRLPKARFSLSTAMDQFAIAFANRFTTARVTRNRLVPRVGRSSFATPDAVDMAHLSLKHRISVTSQLAPSVKLVFRRQSLD
jgi:hypothetical protein